MFFDFNKNLLHSLSSKLIVLIFSPKKIFQLDYKTDQQVKLIYSLLCGANACQYFFEK